MSYLEFKNTRHFPYLDGIRAIAILMVIFHHTSLNYGPSGSFNWGHSGVQVFFLLSGFLITTLLLREQENTGGINLKNFYMRRTLRIFPVYYLILGIYCLMVLFHEKNPAEAQEFWHNLPYFATYTYNLVIPENHGRVIFFLAWSLATEEQFYLVWPFLVKHMGTLAIPVMLTLGYFLPFVSVAICLGSLLAFVMNTEVGYDLLSNLFGWVPRSLNWFLSNPLVVKLGVVSYGVYLTHGIVMRVVSLVYHGSLPIYFTLVTFASLGVGLVLFNVYEKPFLRLKRKYEVRIQEGINNPHDIRLRTNSINTVAVNNQ